MPDAVTNECDKSFQIFATLLNESFLYNLVAQIYEVHIRFKI